MPSAAISAATPATNEPLLLRHDDRGIVTLTLNRPRQYNALCDPLLGELQTQLDAIAADAAVRIVVIAGAGPAFCAGHDLKEMRARPDQAYYRDLFQRCSRLMLTMTEMPQPVIARVHGIATAAGCQLVATCDLAVARRRRASPPPASMSACSARPRPWPSAGTCRRSMPSRCS